MADLGEDFSMVLDPETAKHLKLGKVVETSTMISETKGKVLQKFKVTKILQRNSEEVYIEGEKLDGDSE